MSSEPLISVVMPNYNGETYISDAIGSVLAQTYTNWELLIVDDASEDGSWPLISEMAQSDARIKAIRNDINQGDAQTRMRGIEKAQGEFYAVLDSDDVFLEDKLGVQVRYLGDHPDCGVVGCDTVIIDSRGAAIGVRRYPGSNSAIKKRCIQKSPFAHSAALIRMDLIRKIGYDCSLSSSSDYDLWFRILSETGGRNLPDYLLKYRRHNKQEKTNVKRTLRNTLKIQSRYLFRKPFFSFMGLFWMLLEVFLLALPDSVTIAFFEKWEYRTFHP